MEAVFQTWLRLYLVLTAELCSVRGGTGFGGMNRSWRTAEAWHCVAGIESPKRAVERLLVKVQSSCISWRCYYHGITIKNNADYGIQTCVVSEISTRTIGYCHGRPDHVVWGILWKEIVNF
jgi:hypothetical protein